MYVYLMIIMAWDFILSAIFRLFDVWIEHFHFSKYFCACTHMDKIVGTMPLKREKPIIFTEITWNWQKL